jgi:hypothetical protein
MSMFNSFASTTKTVIEPSVDEGPHNKAHYKLKQLISKKGRKSKIPKNPPDRRIPTGQT